jgi:citrate lyase subunit beta / citryl-CoA lyase
MTEAMPLARSIMFVPGSKQRMIDKALGLTNLDVALFDIEDGVAPPEKRLAREQIRAMLARPRAKGSPARFVRVNGVGSGTDRIDADLAHVIAPGLEGLAVPKVDTPDQLRFVADVLDREEPRQGITPGSVKIIAAIESAIGLINAPAIAASSPRLAGLLFGAEDYALDLGLTSDRQGEARELIYARSAFVNAAASAHVAAFDGVWPDIHDAEGVRRDALQARRLGMTGKSTFHPGQIDIINEVFTPTESELDYARRVVAAFDEAQARGDGAVAFGGQLLDLPIVERARRSLAFAGALRERAGG